MVLSLPSGGSYHEPCLILLWHTDTERTPVPPVASDAPTAPAIPEITPAEWDYIVTLHACGYPPSTIAQMLPSYTARRYRLYKVKVDDVLRMLKDQ